MVIELPILWHTDDTYHLESAGMKFDPDDLEQRMITFYSIDVISPNFGYDNKEYCNIHSSGEKWLCSLTYAEVKDLIKKKKLEYE